MKRRLREKITRRGIDARGRTVYVNRLGKRAVCRLDREIWDDPIMRESGCADEFAEAYERRDRRDGCPACIERRMP